MGRERTPPECWNHSFCHFGFVVLSFLLFHSPSLFLSSQYYFKWTSFFHTTPMPAAPDIMMSLPLPTAMLKMAGVDTNVSGGLHVIDRRDTLVFLLVLMNSCLSHGSVVIPKKYFPQDTPPKQTLQILTKKQASSRSRDVVIHRGDKLSQISSGFLWGSSDVLLGSPLSRGLLRCKINK